MTDIFAVLTDSAVILFDLLLYSMLFALKKETALYRFFMYGGCAVILTLYFFAAYRWNMPASLAAAAFMSIPSFLLFLALARYKGSRFLLTFSFVDTVSLIIAFLGRYLGMLVHGSSVWTFCTVLLLCLGVIVFGRKYLRQYQRLMEIPDAGWGTMAAATVLIYFALIFFAAYPKPMVERVEYAPCWLVFAAVVLVCYGVFFQSIRKTGRIQRQNEKLEEEKKLFHLVYVDALTGLYNRAAYMERINRLERERGSGSVCCVMLDCDRFKKINDKFGHNAGDKALQRVAKAMETAFSPQTQDIYRIGGDEFAALLLDAPREAVEKNLRRLEKELSQAEPDETPLTMSYGFAFAGQKESIEDAFIRADQRMYEHKRRFPGA